MAKEIEIGVKVNGLTDLRQQLKAARDEVIALQNADIVDEAKIQAATQRAGQLKDALNDANEQIAVMAGGSDFEKVSNGLGLIGGQLANMDFEGAAASAQNLTNVVKSMSPETVANGFKSMITTVGQLGKAFVTMGLQLLANPLFLLVAVVTAIVVAIVMLKDKLVIAQKAFDLLMAPINLVIDGLKSLTDWMGITAFAAEDSANRQIAASKKASAANKEATDNAIKSIDREIKLRQAAGKDTTDLELKKQDTLIKGSKNELATARETYAELDNLRKGGKVKLNEDQQKELEDAAKTIKTEKQNLLDYQNEKQVIITSKNKELSDKEQKDRDDKQKKTEAANQKLNQEQQRHKDALKALEQKYADEITDLNAKTDEDRLKNQKAREQREIDALKAKGLNVTKAQQELDEKYNILETNLAQSKVDKLKAITDQYNKDILLIKDKSRQAQLAQDEIDALAEIDKITGDETKKEEAKKAVRDKYALLKREADAATFEEENTKALEKANNEALSFEQRYAIVDAQEKLLTENKNLTEEERTRIEKENAAARKAIGDAEFNAKQAMLGAMSQLANIAADELGKSTVAGKALAVAAATISTYAAIAGQLKAFSEVPIPGYAIAQAIATGAMGLVQVKKILSVKVPAKSGGSGGSAPSSISGGSTPVAPALGLTGNVTQFNQTREGEARVAQAQQPVIQVRAVISETELTDTQNRVSRIRTNAEL